MLRYKHSVALMLALLLCGPSFLAASAEGLNLSLQFSDGTTVRPEAVDRQDAYWARVHPGTPLDHVLLTFDGEEGADYRPASGSYLSFPDAGSGMTGAAYVPLQCMDSQGSLIRTIRLYVSTSLVAEAGQEEEISLTARLTQDAPLLDMNGQPHALSGTLARDTLVHVTGKRLTDQGVLCRVELNGEVVYVTESAVSYDSLDVYDSLNQLFSPDDSGDHALRYAVTAYEAGIRSGKGNNDRNLLGRTGKNMLVFVFSKIMDDDGKLLDLVYCPEMSLFGYIHDSQLTFLTAEEAEKLFQDGSVQEQDAEFQEAVVQTETSLFSYPDVKSAVIAGLPNGKTVYVYTRISGTEAGWYLAQADELLGYVPESCLLLTDEKKPASESLIRQRDDQSLNSRYAAVLSAEVLLYASPSLGAACAGRVHSGDILTVQEDHIEGDGLSWYLVSAGDLSGYVLEKQTERLLIGSYLLGAAESDEVNKGHE